MLPTLKLLKTVKEFIVVHSIETTLDMIENTGKVFKSFFKATFVLH